MPDARWKATERKVCGDLGMKRIGPTGRLGPDCENHWLAVQVKERAKLPDWLTGPLKLIRKQAGSERLGILVLHGKGMRDYLVVMTLADFKSINLNPDDEEVVQDALRAAKRRRLDDADE